jgi:ribonuclease T2
MPAQLALALALAAVAVVVAGADAADNSWDFLLYVSRWSGSAAYGQYLPYNVSSFTLHGIWPTRNDGSWPSYCTDAKFDPTAIRSLIPTLSAIWYDYDRAPHYSFWTHEWSKHGTCALTDQTIGSQYGYFASAITMHKTAAIRSALSQAGIVPSDSQTYKQSDVEAAIKSALGVTPILQCQDVRDLGKALFRVQVCFDKSLNLQECPSSMLKNGDSGCSSDTYLHYPTIKH